MVTEESDIKGSEGELVTHVIATVNSELLSGASACTQERHTNHTAVREDEVQSVDIVEVRWQLAATADRVKAVISSGNRLLAVGPLREPAAFCSAEIFETTIKVEDDNSRGSIDVDGVREQLAKMDARLNALMSMSKRGAVPESNAAKVPFYWEPRGQITYAGDGIESCRPLQDWAPQPMAEPVPEPESHLSRNLNEAVKQLLAFNQDYTGDDNQAHHQFVVRQTSRTGIQNICWEQTNHTIRVDDSMIWKWSHGPLSIRSCDSNCMPLPPHHPCAVSSGAPIHSGIWRVKMHVPGKYYFCSSLGSDDKQVAAGHIIVLTEFQKARRDLMNSSRGLVAVFVTMWLLVAGIFYVLVLSVWKDGLPDGTENLKQTPLTAVVYSLLPTVMISIMPPMASGVVILLMLLPLAVLRTAQKPSLISFGRGYSDQTHIRVRVLMALLVALLLGAIVWGWLTTIELTFQSEKVVSVLTLLVQQNLEYFIAALSQVAVILDSASAVNPQLGLRIENEIQAMGLNTTDILAQADQYAYAIRMLSEQGKELWVSAQRIVLFGTFIFLQAATVAAATGLSAALRGSASLMRVTGWAAALSLMGFFFALRSLFFVLQ